MNTKKAMITSMDRSKLLFLDIVYFSTLLGKAIMNSKMIFRVYFGSLFF